MSEITSDVVKKIAKLSRIRIDENEIEGVAQKISGIVSWVAQLDKVNIENIAPSAGGIDMPLKKRQDVISDGGYPNEIVKNAPVKDENFFCVPKVVE